MNQKTTTYTPRTRHWHKLLLCVGLVAALGVEECEFDLGFVSIDSPQAKTFTEAQTVMITATALEGEGLTVVGVDFYRNGRKMGTDVAAPYTYRWSITAADNDQGPHRWHAEAVYQVGSTGEERLKSDEVVYEVGIEEAPSPTGVLGTVSDVSVGKPEVAVDSAGKIAVVASESGLLTIVDIADRSRPRIRSRLDLEGSDRAVAIKDNLAFVGTTVPVTGSIPRGSLVIVDLTNPDRPSVLSETVVPSPVADVMATGSLAFLASSRGVQIFSVADPRSPELLGSTDRFVDSLSLSNSGLIVGVYESGFGLLDVSNPSDPTPKWGAKVQLGKMAVVGNRLYGIASGIFLKEYEVSASGPVFIGRTPTSRQVVDIEALSDRAFLASADGISVLDLRSSDRRVIEEIDIGPVYSLAIHEAAKILVAVDAIGTLSLIGL